MVSCHVIIPETSKVPKAINNESKLYGLKEIKPWWAALWLPRDTELFEEYKMLLEVPIKKRG